MEVAKPIFRVGQLVYAKMKHFPPWPAIILEVKNRLARVQFFGWNEQWYEMFEKNLRQIFYIMVNCDFLGVGSDSGNCLPQVLERKLYNNIIIVILNSPVQ